jgi:hypothetical protein
MTGLGLKERVLDMEVVEFLAVLEVLGIEDAAIGFESGGDDKGVVPGEGVAVGKIEGAVVEGARGVYRQERSQRI